jgi:hypothetical protein
MRFLQREILVELSAMRTFSTMHGRSSVLASRTCGFNGQDGEMTDTVRAAQGFGRYRSFSPSSTACYGISRVPAVHFCTVLRRPSG